MQADASLAVQCLDRALRELSVQWPLETRRTILTAVGLSYQYLGLFAPAAAALRRAYEIARLIGGAVPELRCGVNLCYALVEPLETGSELEPHAAEALRDEARGLMARIDELLPDDASDQLYYATRDATARLAMACGDLQQAVDRLRACLDRGTEARPLHLVSWAIDLAFAAQGLGRADEATRWARQAREWIAAGAPEPGNLVEFRRMARLAVVEGDAQAAMAWMRRLHARVVVRQQAMLDARAAELSALESRQSLHLELAELRQRDSGLRQQFQALETLSRTDALTGLLNRRGLDAEAALLRQGRQPFVLAILDVDHFKRINDTHSHGVGDRVLAALSACMSQALRDGDSLARYGGEEFALLMPGAQLNQAAAVLERLRERVERHPWADLAPGLAVTVSAGLAASPFDVSFDDAVARADRALYQAKAAGRNRVVVDAEPGNALGRH